MVLTLPRGWQVLPKSWTHKTPTQCRFAALDGLDSDARWEHMVDLLKILAQEILGPSKRALHGPTHEKKQGGPRKKGPKEAAVRPKQLANGGKPMTQVPTAQAILDRGKGLAPPTQSFSDEQWPSLACSVKNSQSWPRKTERGHQAGSSVVPHGTSCILGDSEDTHPPMFSFYVKSEYFCVELPWSRVC